MNRKMILRIVIFVLAVNLLIPITGLTEQSDSNESSISVSFHIGYFYPSGEWAEHPYANVKQFSKDMTFGGDVEKRLGSDWSLSVTFAYQPLDMSGWINYARLQGDTVDASASLICFGSLLKGRLINGRYFALKAGFGAGYLLANGEETYNGLSYKYDFLKSGFCALGELEADQYFVENFALVLKATFLYGFSGVEYAASSDMQNFQGFVITGGIRLDL